MLAKARLEMDSKIEFLGEEYKKVSHFFVKTLRAHR